ncbi:MAG: hypothetical protein ACE15C_18830 [Phycisphaerae bacterium]
MLTNRRQLGLAVTEQGITAVEVGPSGGGRAVLHTAVLPFSKDLGLDQPEKLGKELRQALRRGGFTASRCLAGVAATWLAAREKILPAADEESLRGILSIATEREFASGPQELAFDFAVSGSDKGGDPNRDTSRLGTPVVAMLAAMPRRMVDQLEAMARAAGVSLTGITSSATALAMATDGQVPPSGRLVLCLLPHGVEMVVQAPGAPRMVRHLPIHMEKGGPAVAELTGELRRMLALAPAGTGELRELLVWDCVGLERSQAESIGKGLDMPSRVCGLEADIGVSGNSSGTPGGVLIQAAALAGGAGQAPVIDFLHSRLAPRKQARFSKRTRLAAIAAAAVIAAGAFLVYEWQAKESELAGLQAQLNKSKDSVKQAREVTDRVKFADGWYDHRPKFLDCLLAITQAFPEDGRVWAVNLTIRENMDVSLTGKATTDRAAMDVLDRLRSDPRMANVKPGPIGPSGAGGPGAKEVSFSVNLNFRGAK